MHVYARESDDDARTFNGVAVHSAEVYIFTREVEDMLKVIKTSEFSCVSHCA